MRAFFIPSNARCHTMGTSATHNAGGRAMNDSNAKKCENIVLDIFRRYILGQRVTDDLIHSIPEDHHSLIRCVQAAVPGDGIITQITKRAGRNYNYDLELEYECTDGSRSILCLEIKQGKALRRIEDTPQVLSLAEKDGDFTPTSDTPVSYAAFFYDTFLERFNAALDVPFTGELPSREDYLKWVYGSQYSKHPWFVYAKDKSPRGSRATSIVAESIGAYLDRYVGDFKPRDIIERLRRTQLHKVFILKDTTTGEWRKDRFTDDVFDLGGTDPVVTLAKGTHGHSHTIVISLPHSTIRALLRWKNHNGVMYPAYQVRVIRHQ